MKSVRSRGPKGQLQKGFTLVELAIVLVIAGIILTGVLKGTDAINKAKVERMVSDLKGLQGTILEFQKRSNRLPGDCNNDGTIALQLPVARNVLVTGTAANIPDAVIRDPATLAVCGTPGNVTSSSDDTPTTAVPGTPGSTAVAATNSFKDLVYSELRRGGVLDSNRTNMEIAKHNNQDVFLVGAMQDAAPATVRANVIVVYGIPVWMAEAIDAEIDGVARDTQTTDKTGPAQSGRVRIWSGGGTAVMAAGTATALPVFTANTASGQYNAGGLNRDDLVSISYQFDTNKLTN